MSLGKVAVAGVGAYAAWKYADGKYGLSKDIMIMKGVMTSAKKMSSIVKRPGASIVMSWYETLAQPGIRKKALFIQAETGRAVSFEEFEELSNRVGNWAAAWGFQPGDCVSLMMDNRPEFVAVWLGLCKAGMSTALINTSIKGKPLVHAMGAAKQVGVIFGTEHASQVEEVAAQLREAGNKCLACWGAGGTVDVAKPGFCDVSLDEVLSSSADTPVPEVLRKDVQVTGPCYYIYTSGTTGLPKACNMSHGKVMALGSVACMGQLKAGDVIYGSGLPLYHSAGNLGVGHALNIGSTYILRAKFSASKQWEDCAKYKANAMQYIGELCRYLLNGRETASDRKHQLRVAFGNGLRPEIWDQFQKRFKVPEILEFYGATEGAGLLVNYCQNYEGQGAVGRNGAIMNFVLPAKIVKFDVEEEAPYRDPKTGFCVECPTGVAGELVNPVKATMKTSSGDMTNFEGYTNKEATEKKLLRNVFQKGDLWYRSGDLLRKDEQGYFYFVDRIGDTFRWKGENVSTMEVSEVLSSFESVVDANVYGVQVPGKDGRACMVAITVADGKTMDMANFGTYCRANLPSYSVPLFVRLLQEDINLTGTFKHQKVEYRNQGCDPAKIADELWWFNNELGAYELYGAEQYGKIASGQSKL